MFQGLWYSFTDLEYVYYWEYCLILGKRAIYAFDCSIFLAKLDTNFFLLSLITSMKKVLVTLSFVVIYKMQSFIIHGACLLAWNMCSIERLLGVLSLPGEEGHLYLIVVYSL